jgi:hypothetical protein
LSITEQTREVALEHWTLGGELRLCDPHSHAAGGGLMGVSFLTRANQVSWGGETEKLMEQPHYLPRPFQG